jgi:hypothetical protein
MASPIVSRKSAHLKMTHHQYIDGIGYLVHEGPPELPLGHGGGSKNCEPSKGTKDGSEHFLQPPRGAPEMILVWVEAERAWRPPHPGRGNRLAWSTDYLSRAGWEYLQPLAKKKR